MKKYILLLLAIPLMSCGKNNGEAPQAQEGSETKTEQVAKSETDGETKALDHSQWNTLLQKYVSSKGIVDYKGFKKDGVALQAYLDLLSKNVPTKTWSNDATLAYWINAYNAYTVKLIVDNYPLKSIRDIKDPWDKEFFTLGTKKYSLGEIENKILRKMNEPRIHFAINCASYSCPNLLNEAFTESKMQSQLDKVAKAFVNDKSKNTIAKDKVEISSIFDWYGADFKTSGTLIKFLNKYSAIKINENAKVTFKDYNWNLNE